ncbi:hypothetical protein EVAR_71750_1 [Eumeta japonica]|uniref:Uncharacterized protein n=1 Tax=Eumeta variegata TaxID=151549 RepID=A0A4C1TG05_EUMVA|nr:hypothetical protein EVAR_71750_1 [Eumeta japonica]
MLYSQATSLATGRTTSIASPSAAGRHVPFVRITTQFCKEAVVNALSYVEAWSEPMAVCIDPLFMAWLAYRPQQISGRDPPSGTMSKIVPSTSQMTRRRSTPPSFGRVPPSRSGSGSELVHTPRPRSQASGSGTKPSKVSAATASKETFWDSKNLIKLYTHLKNIMVNIEIGFIVVYISPNSASALDCATVRDAMERHTAAGNKVFVAR